MSGRDKRVSDDQEARRRMMMSWMKKKKKKIWWSKADDFFSRDKRDEFLSFSSLLMMIIIIGQSGDCDDFVLPFLCLLNELWSDLTVRETCHQVIPVEKKKKF